MFHNPTTIPIMAPIDNPEPFSRFNVMPHPEEGEVPFCCVEK
jgi:hypothetical protein